MVNLEGGSVKKDEKNEKKVKIGTTHVSLTTQINEIDKRRTVLEST